MIEQTQKFFPSEWCYRSKERERFMQEALDFTSAKVIDVLKFRRRIILYVGSRDYYGITSFQNARVKDLLNHLGVSSITELKGYSVRVYTTRKEMFGQVCDIICGVSSIMSRTV